MERCRYKEAGPQLLLQAFLQRIVNGGGRIEREYGLGRMRTDLLVLGPAPNGEAAGQRIVIECKVAHGSVDRTVQAGIERTRAYMDRCAADEGCLAVLDRRPETSWEDKVFRRDSGTAGRGSWSGHVTAGAWRAPPRNAGDVERFQKRQLRARSEAVRQFESALPRLTIQIQDGDSSLAAI